MADQPRPTYLERYRQALAQREQGRLASSRNELGEETSSHCPTCRTPMTAIGGEWYCPQCRDFRVPVDDPDFSDEEAQGPQEEDWVTYDHRTVWQVGSQRSVLRLKEGENFARAVLEEMERQGYFPNLWFVSDHGNPHLLQLYQEPSSPAEKLWRRHQLERYQPAAYQREGPGPRGRLQPFEPDFPPTTALQSNDQRIGSRVDFQPGETHRITIAHSEVAIHMGLAGQTLAVKLLEGGRAAQIHDPQGRPFSAPVTVGEAGLYRGDEGEFYGYNGEHSHDRVEGGLAAAERTKDGSSFQIQEVKQETIGGLNGLAYAYEGKQKAGWSAVLTMGGYTYRLSQLEGESEWTADALLDAKGYPQFSHGFGARYLRTQVIDRKAYPEVVAALERAVKAGGVVEGGPTMPAVSQDRNAQPAQVALAGAVVLALGAVAALAIFNRPQTQPQNTIPPGLPAISSSAIAGLPI